MDALHGKYHHCTGIYAMRNTVRCSTRFMNQFQGGNAITRGAAVVR
jgi:hypothetical protein